MENYKDVLEDLLGEAEITIRDAYQRGIEKGGRTNRAVLEGKKDMLVKFINYKNKFNEFKAEDEFYFVHRSPNVESPINLEQLIKNFLLTYDDGEN
jgi:hypothetical protein